MPYALPSHALEAAQVPATAEAKFLHESIEIWYIFQRYCPPTNPADQQALSPQAPEYMHRASPPASPENHQPLPTLPSPYIIFTSPPASPEDQLPLPPPSSPHIIFASPPESPDPEPLLQSPSSESPLATMAGAHGLLLRDGDISGEAESVISSFSCPSTCAGLRKVRSFEQMMYLKRHHEGIPDAVGERNAYVRRALIHEY